MQNDSAAILQLHWTRRVVCKILECKVAANINNEGLATAVTHSRCVRTGACCRPGRIPAMRWGRDGEAITSTRAKGALPPEIARDTTLEFDLEIATLRRGIEVAGRRVRTCTERRPHRRRKR